MNEDMLELEDDNDFKVAADIKIKKRFKEKNSQTREEAIKQKMAELRAQRR